MLKKGQKCLTENQCSRKDSKYCSVCKSCSTKTMLYVCESGHVICAHCQADNNAKESKKDRGDCSSEVQSNCNRYQATHTIKQHKSELIHKKSKELASGDCDKTAIVTSLKRKAKSEQEIRSMNDNNKGKDLTEVKKEDYNNIKTTIEYKNVNFKDIESSDSDLSAQLPISEKDLVKGNKDSEECLASEACPRPVICPVLNCGKTIAMNSAMLHFFYDHPKVPRLFITKGSSQETTLKVSDISMKTQCLNIFLLQGKECSKNIERKISSTEIFHDTNFTPLLLMSARLLTKQFKSELNKKQYTKNKHNKNITDNESDAFQENEILLLWISKLEEPSIKYSMTLMSKDKNHGLSYVGESVHIRKDLDALAILQSAESLVIHGPALNKILYNGKLSVFVNLLD